MRFLFASGWFVAQVIQQRPKHLVRHSLEPEVGAEGAIRLLY